MCYVSYGISGIVRNGNGVQIHTGHITIDGLLARRAVHILDVMGILNNPFDENIDVCFIGNTMYIDDYCDRWRWMFDLKQNRSCHKIMDTENCFYDWTEWEELYCPAF